MRIINTILLIVFLTTISNSQDTVDIKYYGVDDTINVYQCRPDSLFRFLYIPENIFDLDYDFIVLDFNTDTSEQVNVIEYQFDWPSNYIDGRFYIVVNPNQIYLRTGHDNPNPDFLLWVKNINREIYNKIKTVISDSSIFKNSEGSCGERCDIFSFSIYSKEIKSPDEWTEYEIARHQKDYYDKLYMNFTKLINIFNTKLSNLNQIIIPDFDTFKEKNNVKIVSELYELDVYPKKSIRLD